MDIFNRFYESLKIPLECGIVHPAEELLEKCVEKDIRRAQHELFQFISNEDSKYIPLRVIGRADKEIWEKIKSPLVDLIKECLYKGNLDTRDSAVICIECLDDKEMWDILKEYASKEKTKYLKEYIEKILEENLTC